MPQRPTNRVRSPAHLDNAYALQVQPTAVGARNYSQCDSMLIGDRAGANTYPYIQVCVCALGSGGWVGGVGLGLRGWLVGGGGWRGGMRGPEHSFRRLMAGECGLRGWTARPCVRLPPLLPRHATKRTFWFAAPTPGSPGESSPRHGRPCLMGATCHPSSFPAGARAQRARGARGLHLQDWRGPAVLLPAARH